MPVIIGTDEAGYGPNLGPLLVAATAWRVPDHPAAENETDLYALLDGTVSTAPRGEALTIADSKQVYSPATGLARLERTILACLGSEGPRTWRQLWKTLVPELDPAEWDLPWHCGFDEPVPVATALPELETAARRWQAGLQAASLDPPQIVADAVFPRAFNRLLDEHQSKGVVLSLRTLGLVRRMVESAPWATARRTVVCCDKHGGRNRYQALLQELFPEYLVEVHRETASASVYRWGPPERRIEFCFRVRGEEQLPTALASMVAKYLRELALRPFNRFWAQQIPGLRPTAGYPVDARRFQAEIAVRQRELDIAPADVWRNK